MIAEVGNRKTMAGLMVLAMSLPASEALAAEQVFELKKVTVSATRVEQSLETASRSISVTDRNAIEQIQPQSVADIVRMQPNTEIAGGPRAGSQTVNIRGLTENKVLQTVDGVRQQFDSGHRPSYLLDPELIARVETLRGPSSSLWGSGALGGVIAQTTINGSDLLDPEQQLGGFVKTGFNDNNHQASSSVAFGLRQGSFDTLLSGYYRDASDIELGNGEALGGSAERNQGALAKAVWQLDDDQSLTFSYRQAESRGSVPTNGTADITSSNFLIARETASANWLVDYRLNPVSEKVNSQFLVYRNAIELDEYRRSDGRQDRTEQTTLGVSINNRSSFGKLDLLYGIDGYREEFDARRRGDNRPRPPEAESENWGLFFQGSYQLAGWTFELGGRQDRYETRADNLGIDRSDSEFSPTVAIGLQPASWLKLVLRNDHAFRAPTSEELYTTGTHFCITANLCNNFVSNPDLKPEQANNLEFLARANLDQLSGQGKLALELSVFRNRVDDFIEQVVIFPDSFPAPDAGITTWENVDKAVIDGYELLAEYQWDALTVAVSYGQTRGEDDRSGSDLTNIPADSLKADLSYAFASRQVIAGLRVTRASKQDRTDYPQNSAGVEYDGYTITDLYASWQPDFIDDALKINLNVNNIADRYYRRAWDEVYEAGREVIVSVKYTF